MYIKKRPRQTQKDIHSNTSIYVATPSYALADKGDGHDGGDDDGHADGHPDGHPDGHDGGHGGHVDGHEAGH